MGQVQPQQKIHDTLFLWLQHTWAGDTGRNPGLFDLLNCRAQAVQIEIIQRDAGRLYGDGGF
jgi:hypothetical protein